MSLGADADNNRDAWKRLVDFDVPAEKLTVLRYIDDKPLPRQDTIPNGIISEFSREELNYDATTNNFNGSKFYDLLAHIIDDDFQSAVQ